MHQKVHITTRRNKKETDKIAVQTEKLEPLEISAEKIISKNIAEKIISKNKKHLKKTSSVRKYEQARWKTGQKITKNSRLSILKVW